MALGIRLLAEELRSLDSASIGAAYMGIGTSFDHPIRIMFLQNLTDKAIKFSTNGTTNNWVLPSNGFLLLDVTTNKTQTIGCFFAEGTRIYAAQLTDKPTTGAVYLTVFYGYDD